MFLALGVYVKDLSGPEQILDPNSLLAIYNQLTCLTNQSTLEKNLELSNNFDPFRQ